MKKFLLIFGTVVGGLLALGPFWGMLGTILGMNRAFDVLGSGGVSDPKALSGAIGLTLHALTFGLLACPIGVALATICIVFLVTVRKPTQTSSVPPPVPGQLPAGSPELPS